LEENFPELTYFIENENQIKVSGNLENSGIINKELVNHNISVLRIDTHKSTLEDYFFEVIARGEKHA